MNNLDSKFQHVQIHNSCRKIIIMTRKDEKRMKNTIKCKFCGKSDHVEYLGGLDWFCNKRCHYKFRHNE